MKDIRSLLMAGHTYHKIINQLHVEHRTFYRLLNAVFEDDRRLLSGNIHDDEILNQVAICEDGLLSQRQDVLRMATDHMLFIEIG